MAPLQSQPEVQDAKNQQEAVSPENQRRSLLMVVFVLCLLLVVETFAATCIGAVAIKPRTVAFALLHRSEGITPMEQAIIFQIRLPRVLAAALVGCALSIAGVLFQGLFRNPMADPYVIGTSGGAALGATLGVVLLPHLALLGFGANEAIGEDRCDQFKRFFSFCLLA